MTISQALLSVGAAAALTAGTAPSAADDPPKPAPAARPPGAPVASLPSVEGEVIDVDHRAHRLRLRTATGEVILSFDRNTLVLTAAGAATPLHLVAGARVRAGRDGELRAAWVEVKPAPSTPAPSP
jgi:hypothetical protein